MASPVAHVQLVVSLGTPIAEADTAAVAATLQAIVTLLEAANNEVRPSDKLIVKSRPLTPGSLELSLDLTVVGAVAAFVVMHLEQIKTALDLVKQYFELRLLCRGKPLPVPTDTGQIVIGNLTVNNSGTLNLLLNPVVNKTVNDAATAIRSDESIKDVKLLQGVERETLVKIEREELSYFQHDGSSPVVDVPLERERQIRTTLVVRSPDLLGDAKWTFNYQEHKIEAEMQDAKFLAEVRAAERAFTAGTRLVVELQIREEYELPSNSYKPKRYTVLKVHELEYQKRLSSAIAQDFRTPAGAR